MLEPGRTFGRYLVEALLGEGGMGQVYRAQDTRLHRRVALKILLAPRGDEATWEEAKARMLREARAAAALEHPCVVGIYDLGAVDGTPYIAMEYVPGKNLHDFVGDVAVPWETKLRWLLDAAGALAAAHEAGLVHRDVKPENVRVREDGRVKVLDFGIARRASSAPTGTGTTEQHGAVPTITGQGMIIGTLQYMPPEQLAGRPLDGRADQFAWGVMAYELFAGQTPWPAQSDVVATVTAILTAPPPPLLARTPYLPPPVVEAIHRTLAKAPEQRFASMPELMAVLEPYAAPPASLGSIPPRLAGSGSSHPIVAPPSSVSGVNPHGPTSLRTGTDRAVALDGARRAETRARAWLAASAIGGFLVVGAVGGGLLALRHARKTASAAGATAAMPTESTSGSAVSLLDLPPPTSTSPAALTAYREGLQAQHDADPDEAIQDFQKAFTEDPGLGGAYLRYALLSFFNDPTDARTHFLKAQQLRSTLAAHEQALLDAFTPLFVQSPADWAAAESKLRAAADAHPHDAELRYFLAWACTWGGNLADARAAQDAALALDPGYAAALESEITTLQLQGDVEGLVRATDRCLEAAPTATSCIEHRLRTYAEYGRCTQYDADAHRFVAMEPDTVEGYEDLAQATLVMGRPLDSAWESLRTSWKHVPNPAHASFFEANDRADFAAAVGDVKGIDLALAAMDKANADRNDEWAHFDYAWTRVLEYTELGALDRAARAADDFLRRRDGWTPDPGVDYFAVAADGVPIMLKALVRAGKMTPAEFEQQRAAWIDGWRTRVTPQVAHYLWVYGYAQVVDTPADARAALDALPAYSPLPPFRPSLMADAHIGRTYALAGRLDDAMPLLERSSKRCDPVEEPFMWVQSSLWLGEALESTGRTADACDAYARVTTQWATMGPRSVTLREAHKRMTALHCAAPPKPH